jgi:hypothetical protein
MDEGSIPLWCTVLLGLVTGAIQQWRMEEAKADE